MNTPMFGYRSIVLKEWMHIRRDPSTFVFALIIPLVQLILFGYALNFNIKHVPALVVNMDRSAQSLNYLQQLQNTRYLQITGSAATPGEAADDIRRNVTKVAIIVPPDFAQRYNTSRPPVVRMLVDGSDSQTTSAVQNALSRPPAAGAKGTVDARLDVLFNPDARTQVFTIPGLVCVLLQLTTVSLTSFSLVKEREQGTLEQLMVSPVGGLGLMLGKLTPYFLLGMGEMCVVLFASWLIFHINIVGSIILLLLLAMLFVLAALSLGLFISTVAQSQSQAMQMTLLTTMPSILLSGYIVPRSTLPGPLYLVSELLPVTHFVSICRGIAVRGAGFTDLLPQFYSLLIITLVLITASTRRFHKSVG